MLLYHGSYYATDTLRPGFEHSQTEIRWDHGQSNRYLYATPQRDLALAMGYASALEQVGILVARVRTRGRRLLIDLEPASWAERAHIAERVAQIYLYEIQDDGGWEPVPNSPSPEYRRHTPVLTAHIAARQVWTHAMLHQHFTITYQQANAPMDKPLILQHFLARLDLLRTVDYLHELLTIPDRVTGELLPDGQIGVDSLCPMYEGRFLLVGGSLHRVTTFTRTGATTYVCQTTDTGIIPSPDEPLLRPTDLLTLTKGVIANHTADEPLTTSVGRVILNQLMFADPFGDLVPFLNAEWKPAAIERTVGDLAIRGVITKTQLDRYIGNLYLCQRTELSVPTLTERALTTDPRVLQLKAELLEKHKAAIAAGDAVVMSQIENQLIALDKEYLQGDPSLGFFISGKSFDIHRKKMLLIGGMSEQFGADGQFNFIENSLSQGLTPKDFAAAANEIRKGSYGRAMETAKGGEETKFLMRVFQETQVVMEDCGTTSGVVVTFTPQSVGNYVYHRVIEADGRLTTITDQSAKSYAGKTVRKRSAMHCKAQGGFCFTCLSDIFRSLDQRSLTMMTTDIGSFFTTLSLKGMHGVKINVQEITNLNQFAF